MLSTPAARDAVSGLLEGLGDEEVRALCVEALRLAYAKRPQPDPDQQLQLHGHLGTELIPLLLKRKGIKAPTVALPLMTNMFIEELAYLPSMRGVAEFVSWFVRAGLAWPLGAVTNLFPITLKLTRAGQRFLTTQDDHPFVPGFVDRLTARCANLPDDVLSLLCDSKECLDHELMRPAIVLMGVAYEVAIDHVVDRLVSANKLPASVASDRAAKRITEIKVNVIDKMPQRTVVEKEARFAIDRAYDFADTLRRRRNEAAHTRPTFAFEDREEAEEFFVSAGRHLPDLWSLS